MNLSNSLDPIWIIWISQNLAGGSLTAKTVASWPTNYIYIFWRLINYRLKLSQIQQSNIVTVEASASIIVIYITQILEKTRKSSD